jgi:hypothetical protein
MKEKDKLDNKIKSSFEGLNRKAPDMLWSQLSDSLNKDSAGIPESHTEDSRLYNKVRESFSSLHKKVPEHIWQSINRQLNIDLVWSRLSKELDKSPSANWQAGRWAALLLLLMLSFAGGRYLYHQHIVLPSSAVAENLPDQGKKVIVEESGRTENTSSRNKEQLKESATSDKRVDHSSSTAEEGEETWKPSPPVVANSTQQRSAVLSKFSLPVKEGRKEISKAPASFSLTSDRSPTSASSEEKGEKASEGSPFIGQEPGKRIVSSPTSIPYGVASLPMSSIPVLLSIQPVVLNALVGAFPADVNKEKWIKLENFSFGPVLAYNNSWLLNNETRRSFDEGSLISTSPTYKQNLGVALHYSLNPKSAIATEFQFISKAGQAYNTFSDGYYQEKSLELSYYKLYLQYQQTFFPQGESLLSDITAKAGFYSGLLHRKKGEIRSTESTYSNFDYGVRFALGQEKKLNRLIIGYGISGERGLTNIFVGNDKMPARFNKTYTFNFGPYLNFRLNSKALMRK